MNSTRPTSPPASQLAALLTLVTLALVAHTTRPAHAYTRERLPGSGVEIFWALPTIEYRLHKNGYSKIDFDSLERTVIDSFDTWNAVACDQPSLVYAGLSDDAGSVFDPLAGDDTNTVIIHEDEWPDGEAFRGVLAITTSRADTGSGEILASDIELNAAPIPIPNTSINLSAYVFTVTDDPATARHDLANTLTHEIGHMLGLAHPVDANGSFTNLDATMFAYADEAEFKKRTLNFDDILAVCTVYADFASEDDAGCALSHAPPRERASRTDPSPVAPIFFTLTALAFTGFTARRRRHSRSRIKNLPVV